MRRAHCFQRQTGRTAATLPRGPLGALGLVVNMIVLWNTIYMEAVLEQLRKAGYPVNEGDKARLSPLIHDHINTQGRHSFTMPEAVIKGELRPLRNPADDPD